MAANFTMSEADRELVQKFLRTVGSMRANTPTKSQLPVISKSSDSYVVKTPGGGIPGRVSLTPGKADCVPYFTLEDGSDSSVVTVYSSLQSLTVYNLSSGAVAGDSYVMVSRDRSGKWFVSGGGGSDSFWAEITQRGPKPNYTYGFNTVYDLAETWTDLTGGAEGIAAAWADIRQVSTTVAWLVIRNATGGTFTVTANGTTGGQAYNVSAGSLQTAINGVLTGGVTVVVTGSGTDGSPFVLTFSDVRTPTVNYASLTPNTSTTPAREVHNRKILTGSIVRMWPGDGGYWFSDLSTTPVTVCVSGGGSATILAGVPNDA